MNWMTRNAGRSLILAAAMLGLALSASACSAREAGVPAAAEKPHATDPKAVTEPLSIQTAAGKRDFKVEIADTEPERQHGLMYRTSLPPMYGMLFIFEQPAPRSFWMHNTYIPLDIIYIGADGRIVSIVHGKPFDDTPLPSLAPAVGVLELYDGEAARLGIAVGDKVEHRMFPQ